MSWAHPLAFHIFLGLPRNRSSFSRSQLNSTFCKHLLCIQIPRERGFKQHCVSISVFISFPLLTPFPLWSQEAKNILQILIWELAAEVKGRILLSGVLRVRSYPKYLCLLWEKEGMCSGSLWFNLKKESQGVNGAISCWIEMSVQVFQTLISFSAKYKCNMDKEQGRHFWLSVGEPGKDLPRRCHLK